MLASLAARVFETLGKDNGQAFEVGNNFAKVKIDFGYLRRQQLTVQTFLSIGGKQMAGSLSEFFRVSRAWPKIRNLWNNLRNEKLFPCQSAFADVRKTHLTFKRIQIRIY